MTSIPAGVDPRRRRNIVFALAAAIGAVDLGSLLYLRRESVDFIAKYRVAQASLHPLGTTLSWRGQAPGAVAGWSRPEPSGTWSSRPVATLQLLAAGRPPSDLLLTVNATPFVHERQLPVRRVAVEANGTPLGTWQFDSGQAVERSMRVPRAAIGDDGRLRVTLRFAESVSPRALQAGYDERELGIHVHEWRLDAAP